MDIEVIVKKYKEAAPLRSYDFDQDDAEKMLRAALTEQAEAYEQRIRQLEAELGGYITVGGGHIVHGTSEALVRVQAYILLDSKHPIEARDTNRYFAKELQAAEQRIRQLEAELAESREQAERMLDAIYKLHPLASRTLWMAFVWNDHNFTHPLDYAREEAKKAGFNCLDDAQEFLADVAMLAAAPAKEAE